MLAESSLPRAGLLVVWGSALRLGQCRPGEFLDAVTAGDRPHRVEGFGFGAGGGLLELVVALRQAGGSPRLVLPVPGDVRGLAGPEAFRGAALDAGQAVVLPARAASPAPGAPPDGEAPFGIGLVPEVRSFAPSSAPPQVRWTAFALQAAPADQVELRQARQELNEAIAQAASELLAAGVGGGPARVLAGLRDARRAGDELNLPPAFPAQAVALIAQTERLTAILELAAADPLGAAVDRFGVSARDAALRPLATAVRRARLAAYNATS